MFATKAKSYYAYAMKFLRATLSANFKESLPANDAVELDLNKPDELAKNKSRQPEWWKSEEQLMQVLYTSD